MPPPIKLHWSRSKPNFGDWLSPLICELISGRSIQYAKITSCDMIAAGSLLQRVKEHFWNRKINIWGSGFIDQQPAHSSKHHFWAIRGQLSASVVPRQFIHAFGDPGLLADQLIGPAKSQKRFELGIVPHYKDRGEASITAIEKQIPGSKIIDVFDAPLEVITQIAQCHRIVSSSLHGLIVADSLKIPNIRLLGGEAIRGGNWKFDDYISIFQLPPTRVHANELQTMDHLDLLLQEYTRPGLEDIKSKLVDAFPQF